MENKGEEKKSYLEMISTAISADNSRTGSSKQVMKYIYFILGMKLF